VPTLNYPHIEFRQDGLAYIAGTRFKVLQIVMDRLAYLWEADEIQRQHPQLTLGQVHSALAYYYDNEDEVNRQLAAREEFAEGFFQNHRNPILEAKLRAARAKP
jgi:uncharacterized protein (DUF433 family)